VFETQKRQIQKQLQIAEEKGADSYSYTERDILYILLMYGLETITLPVEGTEIVVKDYVYSEVVEGGMEFLHDLHKAIFTEYYEHVAQKQDEIESYLIHHPNQHIIRVVVDIISTEKKLSKFWIKKESYVETERDKLPFLVFETVVTYKKRRIELERNKLVEKLQEERDSEKLLLLSNRISVYNKTINEISKNLKHVS